MSSSSYEPNEPASTISDEVAWLQGAFISSLLCGVQITLSAMSFLAVLRQRLSRRRRNALLIYILLLCAVMTAGQQVGLLFIQMGFIEQRNYPGGPNAFLSDRFTTPVDIVSTTLFVFGNWMMETLMVWRCKVVFSMGEQSVWIGVAFPFLLLISEYVTGTLFLYEMLQGGDTTNYTIAYSGLSLLLNITVTAIIAGRLLLHRRWMVRQFGPGHGSHYASVAAVLVESASFYTGFLVLFLVFFTFDSPTSNVLQQAIAHIESIGSLLIIYRIAHGKGWHDAVAVSSVDWRGSTDVSQEMHAVIHLESSSDPARAVMRTPSALDKENEIPTRTSASFIDRDDPDIV